MWEIYAWTPQYQPYIVIRKNIDMNYFKADFSTALFITLPSNTQNDPQHLTAQPAYIQTTSKCASMDAQHSSKTHSPKNTLLSSNIANIAMGFVQEKLDAQHASQMHTKNLRKTQCTKTPLLFNEELDVRGFSRGNLDAHCASLGRTLSATCHFC